MNALKYILVLAIIIHLIVPTETGRWFKKIKKTVKKWVKKVKDVVKKVCKTLYGFKCPWNNDVVDVLSPEKIKAIKAGICKVHKVLKKICRGKRSVNPVYDLYPFPENFEFYDYNKDKMISFYEFQKALVQTFNLKDLMDLEEPFLFADLNGDGNLDTDEFKGGPFLFAHEFYEYGHSQNDTVSSAA